jgi:hypothetical protein
VVPAASPFVIAGISNLGSLPVYVQTVFVPRRGHITLPLVSGQTVSLSAYKIDTDQVVAFVNYGVSGQKLLSATQDYILDTSGKFTPLNPTGTSTVDVFYVEEFPAYKCSIDQVHWSPVRMLDTARPYPDDETDFLPITFSTDDQGNLAMPITDELGVATGLSIRMGTSVVSESYLLEAMCVASPDTVGAVAQLEVDFAQAGYLNILRLTPFTTFPMVLKKVEVQGLLDNTRQTVWSGSVPLNQSTAVRLDAVLGSTPLVAKAFLTFYQPNYTLKQQTVTPPDALRRDIMGQLQTVLPFYARNVQAPLPAVYTGAQYEFGVADVSGQCWTGMPGVFTSGPHQFAGCPEVIRFDAEFSSAAGDPALNRIPVASGSSGVLSADTSAVAATAVDLYLCYQAFNAAGVVLDENLAGVALSSGAAQVFPFGTGLVPSAVDHVDIYIKIVHRTLTTVFNSLLIDSNDSIIADRLNRLQDALSTLSFPTREQYQAAIYSMVNKVLNLGDGMQKLVQVNSRPAIVGDLTTNLTLLNQDSNDIATELLRIENNSADLYNLAAASQNALRQLIRQAIYTSNQKLYVEPFIDDDALGSGYTATLDYNAGLATLPLGTETVLTPSISIGLASVGTAVNDISNLQSTVVGTSFQWTGPSLELILAFPAPTRLNRLRIELDDYEGLEITALTSSPDGLISNDVLADMGETAIVMDAISGKCSGDVILDFPPRIVQQMRIVIAGRGNQAGFGLRSLLAYSRTYQSAGQMTSKPIYLSSTQAQFSTDEFVSAPFTTISHQVSTDGVNFVNIAPGPVEVSQPFWYRAMLGRSDSAFNQQSSSLLPLSAGAGTPYTIVSQTTVALNNGIVEQTIVLSDITGPVVFQDAPLPGSFRVQAGSLFLSRTSDYTLSGTALGFSTPQSLVTITYQTSALGAAALASLKNYYTPLLYEACFQAI